MGADPTDPLPLDTRPAILASATERRVAPCCEAFLDRTSEGIRVGRCERRVHVGEPSPSPHVAAFLDAQSGTERWFEWLA